MLVIEIDYHDESMSDSAHQRATLYLARDLLPITIDGEPSALLVAADAIAVDPL